MLAKTVVILLLIGAVVGTEDADVEDERDDLVDSSETVNSKREAEISDSYGPPSPGEKEPDSEYGPPKFSHPSSPSGYSKSIPAAAIRNVETVAVTKTITPVVTKTTTYNTHSEPAISIGHVQGYSHSATGQPKIAPVQFQTQYTTYHNPTVGVNGPVTYTGPAVVVGNGYAIPLSGLNLNSIANNSPFSLASAYGAPSERESAPSPVYASPLSNEESAPSSTYGLPRQTEGSQYGSYSMSVPQYVSLSQSASDDSSSQYALSLLEKLQKLRAPDPYPHQVAASSFSPVIRRSPSSPFAFLTRTRPINPVALQASPSTSFATALRYHPQRAHRQQQSIYPQRHEAHQHQPISQPTVQYVQTYAMPSISFTRLQPVNGINKHLPSHQYSRYRNAFRK